MDTFDLFFKKYAYKFPKGYPDINDEADKKLLFELIYKIIPESEFKTPVSEEIENINTDEEHLQENN